MKCSVLIVFLACIAVCCSRSAPSGDARLTSRDICYHPNCITHGYGCVGTYGPCRGVCYCIGSGYEYKCHYCDEIFG